MVLKYKKLQISSTKLQMVRQAHHPEQSRRANHSASGGSIFNDQNIPHLRIASHHKPWSAADNAIGSSNTAMFCLEFGVWKLGFI
jgi:hypothetical protein